MESEREDHEQRPEDNRVRHVQPAEGPQSQTARPRHAGSIPDGTPTEPDHEAYSATVRTTITAPNITGATTPARALSFCDIRGSPSAGPDDPLYASVVRRLARWLRVVAPLLTADLARVRVPAASGRRGSNSAST